MKAKSAIAKGKLLEDYVCQQIREKGLDPKAYRSHGSGNGNNEKSDIWTSLMCLGQNVGFECKNQSTLCIPEWWRQTRKLESLSREPVLVFKQFGEALEEAKVVIYLDTFLELIRNSQQIEISGVENEDPKKRYAIKRMIDDAKTVIKYFEKYNA